VIRVSYANVTACVTAGHVRRIRTAYASVVTGHTVECGSSCCAICERPGLVRYTLLCTLSVLTTVLYSLYSVVKVVAEIRDQSES